MTRESYNLSFNESPYGPLPSVKEAVSEVTTRINRYPDSSAATLAAVLADRLDVPSAHVVVGCGSAAVAHDAVGTVSSPDGEVMFAWPSFEAYPHLASRVGMKTVTVPLLNGAHDLAAMTAAITGRTRAIFVCNPNNPTGTVVHRGPLTDFLNAVPSDCLVVVDEAYGEYVRDRDVPDGLSLYRDRPNVAVLRTFSKAYGLAGLRVGYLIAHAHLADAVRGFMLPFTVNSLAQAAAVASLAAGAELEERVRLVIGERERIRHELLAQGWTVPRSEANFLWLPLGERTSAFAAHCEDAGIIVRAYPCVGARVTVATPEANDAFLSAAKSFSRPEPQSPPRSRKRRNRGSASHETGLMPATFLPAQWIQADLHFKADVFPEDLVASVIAPRLDQLQEAGSVPNWWFMRKPPGCRIRLHEADSSLVREVLEGLTDEGAIAGWKPAIYEPETTAFGGPAGMDAAHALFCADTRGFLGYLTGDARHIERRDLSLLLISTMLTAAGLDWFERGDVFARIAALRPGPAPDAAAQRELTRQCGILLADTASGTAEAFAANGAAGFAASWRDVFDTAGRRFAEANDQGKLHRGLRTILAQVVIFHWNRLGFKATPQRLVAHAMTDMHLPRI